jgi:GNAT superfamily N-acetyltransferase
MASFQDYSSTEIVEFIDANFGLFSTERSDDFPANVLDGIARGVFAVITLNEGFAIAYKGRRYSFGNGYVEANLMFLYVAPEYEHSGVGSRLIEEVKREVTPGAPIIMQCEGSGRRRFFAKCGFVVTDSFVEPESYDMRYEPASS